MTWEEILKLSALVVVLTLLYLERHRIAEALRNLPWGRGGPPGIGPAPAADPFTHLRKHKSGKLTPPGVE